MPTLATAVTDRETWTRPRATLTSPTRSAAPAVAQPAVPQYVDRCPKISGGVGQCAHLVISKRELLRGGPAGELHAVSGVDCDKPRPYGVTKHLVQYLVSLHHWAADRPLRVVVVVVDALRVAVRWDRWHGCARGPARQRAVMSRNGVSFHRGSTTTSSSERYPARVLGLSPCLQVEPRSAHGAEGG